MTPRIRPDSPLKSPPLPVSERQIMLLDGIRHAADMSAIALDRLWQKLSYIDSTGDNITSADLAEAALDAWSIVDAAHRIGDLIGNLPGLPNAPWKRVFLDRMKLAMEFRNDWQHQLDDVHRVVGERGQVWGAVAWHQHRGATPTGWWFLAVIGSDLKGSQWLHAGPANAIPRVDSRRIRLIHCNRELYLNRLVHDIFEAIDELEKVVASGSLALRGECVNQERTKDWVMSSAIQVVVGTRPELPGND
jgi:hypothetical protein